MYSSHGTVENTQYCQGGRNNPMLAKGGTIVFLYSFHMEMGVFYWVQYIITPDTYKGSKKYIHNVSGTF